MVDEDVARLLADRVKSSVEMEMRTGDDKEMEGAVWCGRFMADY